MIQIRQLIRPFLPIIPLLKFLQNCNSLFQTDILRLIKPVLQYISARILRRYLYKFLIVFTCLVVLPHLDTKLTQRVDDQSARRVLFISQKKNILALLKASVNFIKIADCTQHHHASDPAPVNFIRNLRCLRVLSLCYQRLDLIRAGFVFKLIQGTHLINVLSLFYPSTQ